MIFLRLFYEFFKAGLFSIGGGMATLPFLQDMAKTTGWFDSNQLADMIAVAESTPGPLGVNMSTYVGYTTGLQAGGGIFTAILGAVIATLALVLPSIIIITIISYFLLKFRSSRYVDAAFYGLRPASVGLIGAAAVSIILLALFEVESIASFSSQFHADIKHILLAVVIFIGTRYVPKLKKMHPLVFIIISAVVGIVFAL